ncbi:MAG: sensor histidine kinase [Austwickia sp.]|nr:sensor histidine kinase [Austwickia sp.]
MRQAPGVISATVRAAPGEPGDAFGRAFVVIPYPLLLVSLIATAAAGAWGTTTGLAPIAALAVAAGIHRWWGDRRPGTPLARAAWYVVQALLSAGLVVLAPLFCIYAFCGYFDAARTLPRRARTPATVGVAAVVALGQSGSLAGVRANPWLYVVLFFVNAGLGPLMAYLEERREADIARREEAVRALGDEQRRSAALQAQLLDQAREAGVIDERQRLSREIHDTVAQGLIGIITQLEAIDPGDDPAGWRPRVARACEVARDSLAEARRAIHALGSPALAEDSLPVALEHAVRRWAQACDVEALMHVDGTAGPGRHDEALLRVAQEAMANIARHSGASRAAITLTYDDREVRLDVRDDGRGFDPTQVAAGTGLTGMRSRIVGVGGELHVETAPGSGCTVSAAVPR